MDLRITKTRNSIINAFIELRSTTPIEKVTIRDLCEKAMINKSTFYTHFRDIYDLSSFIEKQIISDMIGSISHPESVFTNPEEFNKELFMAIFSHDSLIRTIFSGSRSGELISSLEESLKKTIFNMRPEYKEDLTANVVLIYEIYGCYHAYEKCKEAGSAEVISIMSEICRKTNELLS